MAKLKMKSGAALLPMLLMAGTAVVAVPSPVFAGFEMKSYAPAPVPAAAPLEMPALAPEKTPAAVGSSDVIPGFGSNLPLAVALQQVAPPGYQFSFAAGVDPGTTVSWTGGKPWPQVLTDMLATQKLGYRQQNNIIAIDRMPAEVVPLTPAAITAAVAPPPAAPLLALSDEDLDEAFADEKVKMDPIVTRRNNRRTSISTRRDFAVEGRRTWFDRLKESFKKRDKVKTEKVVAEKEKTAVAEKDIQWSAEAPEQKMPAVAAAPVESMALAAPPAAINWDSSAPATADAPAVSGFGADMPLAIALQQVVPSGYDLSYVGGINKNTTVSWEGGRPWQQVLTDMLAPQKLGYQLDGNIVTISRLADKKAPAPYTASRDESGEMLAPLALTRREEAKEISAPAAVAASEKASEEIPAATGGDPIVSRRNTIAGGGDSATGQRSWMERLKERFNLKKGDQGKETEAAPAKAAEESAVPETSAVEMRTSRRRTRAAEMPAAMEVAPPPAAAPLMAAAKPAAEKPAAAPAAEAVPTPAKPVWLAAKDRTLRDVLSEWSKTAGVELYWSTDYDYHLKGNIAYSGSFDEAVGQLLGGFTEIRPQPYGRLHQMQDGSRVLVVNTYTLYN